MGKKNQAKIEFIAVTGEFNNDINESSQAISEMGAALKLNKEQMKTNGKSVELLEEKHDLLENQLEASKRKTEALSNKLNKAVSIFGENSIEASKLKTQLLNTQSAEEKIKQSINQCNDELDEQSQGFTNVGKSAENSSGGFTITKGALADLASKGFQFALQKATEFAEYLVGLPEATREFRQDISSLHTSFDTMNFDSTQATETYKNLFAVFGESDRSVETANNISKMAKSQEELNTWVNITTGIWGSYQDSLPVEGLAEASNETAKVGKVTGVLADALNWSSEASTMFADKMGGEVVTAEDAFNVALSEVTTEQERQQLITETLNSLYSDSADKYRDVAGAQMEAKEASAEQQLVEGQLADTIEPVTTSLSQYKTELLVGVIPTVEKLSDAAGKAINWMREHPVAMQVIIGVVGVMTAALTALAVATAVQTAAQWAMNSAILANPTTGIVVGVVAAITALIAAGVLLYKNWDTIKAKATELKDNTVGKFNELKDKASASFNSIKEKMTAPIDKAREKVKSDIDKIKGFFSGLKLELPKIKTPHFKLVGEFSISKRTVPKLTVDWYAAGGILTKPTMFGINGNMPMVGGEAGPEAILPIEKLKDFIKEDADSRVEIIDLQSLANAIDHLANRPVDLYVDDKKLARATAGASDQVNGIRQVLKNRGAAL